MPSVPYELFMGALEGLIDLDRDWVPGDADGSLYIRPFVIATEPRVGVKVSDEYLFMVVATPAYQYYSEPLRVKVETDFARAAEGGRALLNAAAITGAHFILRKKRARKDSTR